MSNGIKKLGLFAALSAAVAGAGAFFLGTKKGQAMTKEAMKVTEKLVNEVMDKFDEIHDLTQEKYEEVLSKSVKTWKETKAGTEEEIDEAKSRIERAWKELNTPGHNHKCDKC